MGKRLIYPTDRINLANLTNPTACGAWQLRLGQGSGLWLVALFFGLCVTVSAVAAQSVDEPQVLDRAVAVVNSQVILASDLDMEMRVFHLLPIGDYGDETAQKALERLTTRALIEQQIVQEDPSGLEISPKDLADSLAELRQNLPACKQRDCTSAAGWSAYLATLGLTPERVDIYWTQRMAVLQFIERRFRSGIRVAPEDIAKYYRENLVPRYAKPGDAPALDRVSPRIQEILLQERVNALLNDWLKSLQGQGQVEILDPALAKADEEKRNQEELNKEGNDGDGDKPDADGPVKPEVKPPGTGGGPHGA